MKSSRKELAVISLFPLALDREAYGRATSPEHYISPSSWDMKARTCSPPSPTPCCLTACSPKHCPGRWSVWEHTNLCKPSLLPLLLRLHSATKHFMLKTRKVSALAVEMAPTETNWHHSYTIAAVAGCLQTCSVLQHWTCSFFWNLLQSPGSNALIFLHETWDAEKQLEASANPSLSSPC